MYKALKKIDANINSRHIKCAVGEEVELSEFEAQVLYRSKSIEKVASDEEDCVTSTYVGKEESVTYTKTAANKKRGRKPKDS